MKKTLLLLVAVFMLIVIAVIYFSKGAKKQVLTGGIIIQASIGDASFLNPVLATDSASGDINDLVYNGLMKYDKDLMIVGDLAESWEVSEDNLKITFYLREGVKWHDGEEFNSEDVNYTYQILMATSTRTARSSRFDLVKNLTTPDKFTVIVEYSKPYSPAMESWGLGIIPEHIFKGTDINTNPRNRNPIGTGPYKFVSWRSDDRIILSANEDYFEGKPLIGRIVYKIIPDQAVQFLEIQKGTIDWMNPTPDQWIKETSKQEFSERFNRFKYPSFAYAYLGYNLNHELFNNVKVRRAINYAIDKQKIIDSVLQGLGRIATGPYPPNSWAYNSRVKDYGYNPEKANNILAEMGWSKNPHTGILEKEGRRFSFTLMTNQGNNTRKLTCEIIQDQLKFIGIDVKVRIQEWSSFIHQYIDKRQFEAVLLGWSLSIDPDQYSIWHSSQQGEGQFNFVGYVNPEVDDLLQAGRTIFDIEKRKKIYNKLHEIIHNDQPYLFLYVTDARHVIHNRFKNIKVEEAGIGYNFIKWYVPDELRKY